MEKQLKLTPSEFNRLKEAINGAILNIHMQRSHRSVEEAEVSEDRDYVLMLAEVEGQEAVKESKAGKKKVEVHEDK